MVNELKLSNSEISVFLDCKRKWWLQYYLGLKKKDDGSEQVTALTYGTRIHDALEGWYAGTGEDPRVAIRRIYTEESTLVASAGGDMKKFEDDRKSSIMLIDHYMDLVENENFDLGWKYVVAEQEYEMELDEGLIFRGKLDAIVERESDGAKFVVDHKTYRAPAQELAVAHLNPQILGYMALYRANNDDYLSGGVFNVFKKVKTLTRSKTDIIIRHIIRHNQKETDKYVERLRVIGNEIRDLRNRLDMGLDPITQAYPHATRDCTWKCPFIHVCGMMEDGSRWEDMLEANFEKHDVDERYVTKE